MGIYDLMGGAFRAYMGRTFMAYGLGNNAQKMLVFRREYFPMQEFSMVGNYTTKLSKLGGGRFHGYGCLPGTIWYMQYFPDQIYYKYIY